MARHRRPRTVASSLRSAAAGTALSVIAAGTASLALSPSAEAATNATTATSSACPVTEAAKTGGGHLAANAPPKLRRDRILTLEDKAASVDVLSNDESSAGPL